MMKHDVLARSDFADFGLFPRIFLKSKNATVGTREAGQQNVLVR